MSMIPGKALLSVQNVVRSYGAQPVLDNVSVTIHEGDRIGFIGRNGSGKSTLMRILAGKDTPDSGLVTRGQALRVSLLEQDCRLPRELSIAQTLESACADKREMLQRYHELLELLAHGEDRKLREECDTLHHTLDVTDAWDLSHELKRISISLQLPDPDRTLGTLSGGELRRVDLACKLLQHPEVLLLDEPTNHIDTRSAEWIEGFLETYSGSCVLVTHDRYFLDRVVNRIVELEFNRIYSFPGSYERFLEYKAAVEETQAKTEDNRLALIRRELAWFRRGAKARSTKQKARIDRLMDVQEEGPPSRHREFLFEIPEPSPLGKTILEARELGVRFGERWLFKGFNLLMQKEMRVGILGPNGSGKTTLLRVLMGIDEATRGRIIRGDNVEFLYVDQAHEDVNPEKTILDYVSDGAKYVEVNKRRIYIPAYLEKFLFDKNSVMMPMGNLSGGERNRLDMVKKLLRGGNFLVLDEPTNDLDLYTLRVLEETIEAFEGCALVVSHDRYFLNRICTHLLVIEADARIVQITGNYDDYLLYKERQAQELRAAAAPAETAKALPRPEKARRLTYLEKQELESMEEQILAKEEEVAAMEAQINTPDFYQQGHKDVQRALDALNEARGAVEALYARWAELEALQRAN